MPGPDYHAWTHRSRAQGGTDPVLIPVVLEIKVFSDTQTVTTGDGKFIFAVAEDLDSTSLIDADAFVSTASTSGTPTVQIRNITRGLDMLSTRVTIDASEFTSYSAATPAVVDVTGATPKNKVFMADMIAVDVDVAGTAAKGLGVILKFAAQGGP